jgi:hypothetical protein
MRRRRSTLPMVEAAAVGAYPPVWTGQLTWNNPDMSATGLPCTSCEREPATRVAIRRHQGMIFLQRFFKVKEPLCRECGMRLLKDWTLRTLWQGWWGYISFFVNWFVLATNLVAFFKLRALAPPQLSTTLAATADAREAAAATAAYDPYPRR